MSRRIVIKKKIIIHCDTYIQVGRVNVGLGKAVRGQLVEEVIGYLRVIEYRSR